MKVLIIFALALVLDSASASVLSTKEVKTRNLVVPAGRPEGRVTNGFNAYEGQFPYQVGLYLKNRQGKTTWCGGSVVNNRFVLTAAHCTADIVEAIVILGSTNIQRSAEVVHTVTGKHILIHPGWDSDTLANDVSLIEIPFTRYSDLIQPVILPSNGRSYSTYESEDVIASGWGRTSDAVAEGADHLQFAHMNVIPNNVCARAFYVRASNICISTYSRVSTCHGDSGGPLVLASSGIQVGITSFGYKFGCEKGYPAVFTRVTSYLDWIKKHTGVSS